ncbi:MAG TPA: twin-arginine translocase subunit TatC, partial [Vicinamibacterales bacterium]
MALVPFPGSAGPASDPDDHHIHLTDPDPIEAGKMSFLDHLDELRKRLIACVYGLVVGCVIAYLFVDRIQNFIWIPLWQQLGGTKFMFTQGFEPFMLTM